MKELPTPTFPFSQLGLRGSPWSASGTAQSADAVPVPRIRADIGAAGASGISVSWARHQDEVRAAQRLRHDVFAGEMGARLSTPIAGHDIDLFDDFCEHLLVRDVATRSVIGTYRVLTPAQARRVGSTYSDIEFDLTRLRDLRERMVEQIGRASCRERV